MLFELIIVLLCGIAAGTITGLIPGIHINLIAVILLSLIIPSPEKLSFILVFIVSMAISHTFINFIPSIFLGAPDEDTGLSTLPGHEFLLKGYGHHAVKLTLIGSTLAVFSLIILIPIFIFLIPKIYFFIERMLGWALILVSILLIYTEKNSKIKVIIIFLLAGFLGFNSLNLPVKEPLLPLLTGLFGSSTIIFSIKTKTKIPPQKIGKIPILKKDLIKPTLATIFISPICALFPGLGTSQAAVIGSTVIKLDKEQFLILIGSVNTLIISLSFLILFLIQKSRTGVASAISQLTILTTSNLKIIFITIFVATLILIPYTNFLSKIFSRNIHKLNYTKLSLMILIFLTIIIIFFTGILGLLIFTSATLLGLTCIELGARRGFLMGSLLIPTIFFYLPI